MRDLIFSDAQLNDLIHAETSELWRAHKKLEMTASAIVALTMGSLVGLRSYLLGDSAGLARPLIFVALTSTLSFVLLLAIIYFYFRFIQAPSNLYFKAIKECDDLQERLDVELARNTDPKLAGRVDCLDHEIGWDLERFAIDTAKCGQMTLKATFTARITLWNGSRAATTVSGFVLDVLWLDGSYSAIALPVTDYAVTETFPRAGEWGHEARQTRLMEFSTSVEVTHENHVCGWVRFLAREIPAEAADNALFRRDVTWRLSALDRKGRQHIVYEGPWDLPPCGSIDRMVY